MLTAVLLLVAFALALSLAVTPVVKAAAVHWRLVDLPDNKRKVHRKPVPRIGGVAICIGYFGSCWLVAALLGNSASPLFHAAKSLAPAALVVFLIGILDDVFGLKPWHKLTGEIAAGVIAVSAGVSLRGVPLLQTHPTLGTLLVIGWLVFCANAVNLIDGLDGLAAGVALVGAGTVLAASLAYGSFALTIATAPLVGALLGFLVFNFNPASIFLGDSGSLLIGFLLGCLSTLWSSKAVTIPAVTAPMIALAVPLLDTGLAVVRRVLRLQPIFSPDRSHIHHRLLALGFSHRRAVLSLYFAAAIAGAFSLWLIVAARPWELLIILAAVAGACLGIQRLGYPEIETAGKILTGQAFLEEVNAQLAVKGLEEKLTAAGTAEECWAVIREAAQVFGFHPIYLQLTGRRFAYEDKTIPRASWTLHMPMLEGDSIDLFHELGPVGHVSAVIPFAEAIRKVLDTKRADLLHELPRTAAAGENGYHGLRSLVHRT